MKSVFKMKGCIFCQALKSQKDSESYILYRGAYNFVILNKYPYNPGHIMVAPFTHLDSLEKADKASTDEITDMVKMSLRILRKHYHPQGFNTGMNIGQSAGAGVVHHYHIHIIPRWAGDSNFMPLVGKTKVVIDSLQKTYDQLLPLFQKAKRGHQS